MICENPYVVSPTRAHPCGACVPCRIKGKGIWATRLLLEASRWKHNAFVTLTYAPVNERWSIQARAPTLIPDDLRLWLYRYRKAIKPRQIRFYACGEYGDAKQRPHYHAILFNQQGCAYGRSRYNDGRTIDCCGHCDLIRDTWGLGIVQVEQMSPQHCNYVVGYVLKKMTSKHDSRLNGRHPEFARQSNQNGGIGINAVPGLAQESAARMARGEPDVVKMVRFDGKLRPIGRYLTNQQRKALGLEQKAPPEATAELTEKLLAMSVLAKTDKEALTLKKQIIKHARGKIESLKAREEIYNSRKRNRSL